MCSVRSRVSSSPLIAQILAMSVLRYLRMSLKVFADCLHERNSRIRLYGDDGFDYVEVQIDFTVKPFAAAALCAVPAIRSSYAEQALFLETRLRLSLHFDRRLPAPSALSWQS